MKLLVVFLLLAVLYGCAVAPITQHQGYVRQESWADCGAAAGAMLVNFAGGSSTNQQAIDVVGKHSWWNGIDITRLLELHGREHQWAALDAVVRDQHRATAVLVSVVPLVNHWIVVQGYQAGLVRVFDPSGLAGGEYWWSVAQLEKRAVTVQGVSVRLADEE